MYAFRRKINTDKSILQRICTGTKGGQKALKGVHEGRGGEKGGEKRTANGCGYMGVLYELGSASCQGRWMY